jgi:hypothetical protein
MPYRYETRVVSLGGHTCLWTRGPANFQAVGFEAARPECWRHSFVASVHALHSSDSFAMVTVIFTWQWLTVALAAVFGDDLYDLAVLQHWATQSVQFTFFSVFVSSQEPARTVQFFCSLGSSFCSLGSSFCSLGSLREQSHTLNTIRHACSNQSRPGEAQPELVRTSANRPRPEPDPSKPRGIPNSVH